MEIPGCTIRDGSISQPDRDYYSVFTQSDGTHVFYRLTMKEHARYEALYSEPPEKWWTYEPPVGAICY